MMFTTFSTTRSIAIVAALLAVAGASAYFFSTKPDAVSMAARIIQECAKANDDRAACYESQVPQLYPQLPVPVLFDIVRSIRRKDPSYQFCHVLGHKIGERVVAEDPNGWVDAISLNPPDGMCSNGFIHGVVGGRFRSEVLDDQTMQKFLPDFRLACAPHNGWQPSDLDRAICYHGMGHLFDFITNADIPKAISMCDAVAPDGYRRVCVQGVFMQIYQPLEPDDYLLIEQMPVKPATTTVRSYCAAFSYDPMAQGSCIEESWPFLEPHITDGTAVGRLCSWEPDATEEDFCYMSMSSIVGRMSLGNTEKVVAACSAFPSDRQMTCFSYSAQAILEEDRDNASGAVSLCERASSPSVAEQCISQLVDHARFMFGVDAKRMSAFCDVLPEVSRTRCLRTAGPSA